MTWRARVGLLLALTLGVLVAIDAAADEGWLIERLDIRLDIQRDGSIAALEALDVDFQGLSRHGIFRDMLIGSIRVVSRLA